MGRRFQSEKKDRLAECSLDIRASMHQTFGCILNPMTKLITLQCHVVYDDYFFTAKNVEEQTIPNKLDGTDCQVKG